MIGLRDWVEAGRPQRLISPDASKVGIDIEAVCHGCKHRHRYRVHPDHFPTAMSEWDAKHRGHDYEFLSPRRFIPKGFRDWVYWMFGIAPWWLEYKHNADIKIAYAADTQPTLTLASLASSSTWVAGRESNSVDNSSNKYIDYEPSGFVTTGTTPTLNTEIRLYIIKPVNDTPTWPDVFDGTDSAETVTNTNILDGLALAWSTSVASTSNLAYPIAKASTLAQLFGVCPALFSAFVSHNNTAALNSTGGNHEFTVRGTYLTSS